MFDTGSMIDTAGMIDQAWDAAEDLGHQVHDVIDDFGGTIRSDGDDGIAAGIGGAVDHVTGGEGIGAHIGTTIDSALDAFGLGGTNANEDAIRNAGANWSGMADTVSQLLDGAEQVGRAVGNGNSGESISRFLQAFGGGGNTPLPGGDALVQGLDQAAGALFGAGAATHAAKVISLAEGVQFFAQQQQALADAWATGGQSLALIPGFREHHAANIHNAVQAAADFVSGRAGGPVSGLLGQALQGTGLIEGLDRLAGATDPDHHAPESPDPDHHAPGAPAPAPAGPSPPGGGNGDAQALAQSYVDRKIPYAWGGGHGPEPGPSQGTSDGGGAADAHGDYNKVGLDCSGLARDYLHQYKGIDIGGGSTYTLKEQGVPVSEADIQPGDLVYPHPGHVQVYIGNGEVLEAKESGTDVMRSPYAGGEIRRYD